MTNNHTFAGKVALITGGTSGIGHATARLLAQRGARVVVTSASPMTAETELGHSNISGLHSDASEPAAIENLISVVTEQHQALDMLVINAGIARFGTMQDLHLDTFDQVMNVNARGPWLLLKNAPRMMPNGGTIVVVSSIAAQLGTPGSTVYAASKAALSTIARAAAIELMAHNIRVNIVSPGPINTPIYGKLGIPDEMAGTFRTQIAAQVPLGRFGEPHEVAAAIIFMLDKDASFLIGAELVIDGGMTLL
jgi:NAD(P)-dependent dehydrogenase (short-subunit alcohol dehydrogenase family)